MKKLAHTCLNERLPVIPADRDLMMVWPGGAG